MNRDHEHVLRKVVLYVEDHPVNVLLMQAVIERLTDLELVVAQDGREALCVAANLEPALILLDLRLPDCRGNELLPLLRLLPGCENAPAVAVTAEDDFDIEGTGFDELWAKPIDVRWVLQRLGALTSLPPHTPATRPPTMADAGLWRERPPTASYAAAMR